MSHFTVLVIGDNPEQQLQPFHEYECTGIKDEHVIFVEDEECDVDETTGKKGHWTNPNRKWDWYVLGGRWTGFFKLKENALATVGRPGIMTEPAEEGHGDAALKSEIDFDAMRNAAGLKAQNEYEYAMAFLKNFPKNETWESLRSRVTDMSVAREIYWAQPRCQVWKIQESSNRKSWPFGWSMSPDDFLITKEQYIENARNSAISTFAIIKDGKWYEKGRMGWWGMVSDEKEQDAWNVEFSKLLDELPDDTLLSVYDCHI